MKEKNRILNEDIKAKFISLIDEEGEFLWEMSLKEAQEKARETSLDLMQVGMRDWLAIVKLLDYWKFLYKQKKQDQKNKQKTKAPDLKTIKITFKIWEHDLEIRKNQAEKFAKLWHPLKVVLTLRWRENQYENIAREKMESFILMLQDFYKVDKNLVKNGNNFVVMMQAK